MSFRARFALIVVLTTFLGGVGVWVSAQAQVQSQATAPVVISGNDIGFRVEGQKRERRRAATDDLSTLMSSWVIRFWFLPLENRAEPSTKRT